MVVTKCSINVIYLCNNVNPSTYQLFKQFPVASIHPTSSNINIRYSGSPPWSCPPPCPTAWRPWWGGSCTVSSPFMHSTSQTERLVVHDIWSTTLLYSCRQGQGLGWCWSSSSPSSMPTWWSARKLRRVLMSMSTGLSYPSVSTSYLLSNLWTMCLMYVVLGLFMFELFLTLPRTPVSSGAVYFFLLGRSSASTIWSGWLESMISVWSLEWSSSRFSSHFFLFLWSQQGLEEGDI